MPAAPVFSGLSLDVRDGEFVSVIGGSGSGKSTLFKLIAGLLDPGRGGISLYGELRPGGLGKSATCRSAISCCRGAR